MQALRSQAQDGWLQRYLAGGRSRQEISEVARSERVEDSREARRTAWARMSLLVLYFNPSGAFVYVFHALFCMLCRKMGVRF